MDWTLEVVVVPVSDIDRAIAFYRDQLGFHLDHHTQGPGMNFAQLTPPGSGCSIVVGDIPGGEAMPPGSLKGLQLVVSDAYRAREELAGRGVDVDDIMVVDERDGGTFFGFRDPDGNAWVVQQIKARAEQPLLPRLDRGD
ncbi:MAG TPA: VOC family protein [Mycobacterium sp.]|nr:VOC family protein [Mycobacterium sp.]